MSLISIHTDKDLFVVEAPSIDYLRTSIYYSRGLWLNLKGVAHHVHESHILSVKDYKGKKKGLNIYKLLKLKG